MPQVPPGQPVQPAVPPASPAPGNAAQPANASQAVRVALILPLRSANLGPPAEAVQAGFMAAYERDRDSVAVTVVPTGDSPQEALDAYAGAVAQHDIVVGPLARSAVSAVASSPVLGKPTIALNIPETRPGIDVPLPERMLAMGLSIEDEARQAASWALAEEGRVSALVLAAGSAWQQRVANAFAAQWKQQGLEVQVFEIAAVNGYLQDASLGQLKMRVEAAEPGLIFAALDADQLRQVRSLLGADLPVYGTSSINPGPQAVAGTPASGDLAGIHVLDLPWLVQPDHPAVMAYPRLQGPHALDHDRLYALGIDAYRVARLIAQGAGPQFALDGVTGRLTVRFGVGPARFERVETPAVYDNGSYTLAPPRK